MNSKTTETTTQRTNRLLGMSRAELVFDAQDLTLRIEELEGAVRLQKEKAAQAVAACKLKDEALKLIALDDCCTDPAPIAQKALAIQPDDDALKAWLGEPQPCRSDGRCQYAIDHGAEGLGHCPVGKCCMPLYSPKGLK